jgi:hypothetical protein
MPNDDGHAAAGDGTGAVLSEVGYDSTADTLKHSLRVGTLLVQVITELMQRAVAHDLSKTREPELSVFNAFTPQLRASTYGSAEYTRNLNAMGEALAHHYRHNRHHPEHFADGINDMTLVDLLEMLADWKAATERTTAGDLRTSLTIQRDRFAIDHQLARILDNTCAHFGWFATASSPSP